MGLMKNISIYVSYNYPALLKRRKFHFSPCVTFIIFSVPGFDTGSVVSGSDVVRLRPHCNNRKKFSHVRASRAARCT